VDFVARGGGNAMAVEGTDKPKLGGIQQENGKKQTNMAKQSSREGGETEAETSALSREDEDVIASLTTRLNAVKTLQSRINLLKSYLSSLPPSSIDPSATTTSDGTSSTHPQIALSHPVLRNISALLSSLNLLTPQDPSTFAIEYLSQENDVILVSLLGQLGRSIQEIRDLSQKVAIIQKMRHSKTQSKSSDQILAGSSQTATLGIGTGGLKKGGGRGKQQRQSIGSNLTATICNATSASGVSTTVKSTDEMDLSRI